MANQTTRSVLVKGQANLKGKAGQVLTNIEGILEEALRHFKAHVEIGVPAQT